MAPVLMKRTVSTCASCNVHGLRLYLRQAELGVAAALIQAAAYGMSRADVEVLLRTQAHASPAHVDRREAAAATSTDSHFNSNPGLFLVQ